MAKPNNGVIIKVHKNFFDKIFEPERKRLQAKFGLSKFTQPQFTEFLAKSNIKITYPKRNNKFAPIKKRRGGLSFNFSL